MQEQSTAAGRRSGHSQVHSWEQRTRGHLQGHEQDVTKKLEEDH